MKKTEKRYQIRLVDKDNNGSFLYFTASENPELKAAEVANEDLEKRLQINEDMKNTFFFSPYKPFKTLSVVEIGEKGSDAVRGGHKFKLGLRFIEAKFKNGTKQRQEWYEPK